MNEIPEVLPPHLAAEIDELAEDGNDLVDDEEYDRALSTFRAGLALVPEPLRKWEAATWFHAAIGDALIGLGRYAEARDAFYEATQCPGGMANPFVQMRLGQMELELGDERAAANGLIAAYMSEGPSIFDDEDAKFLQFLRDQGLI